MLHAPLIVYFFTYYINSILRVAPVT